MANLIQNIANLIQNMANPIKIKNAPNPWTNWRIVIHSEERGFSQLKSGNWHPSSVHLWSAIWRPRSTKQSINIKSPNPIRVIPSRQPSTWRNSWLPSILGSKKVNLQWKYRDMNVRLFEGLWTFIVSLNILLETHLNLETIRVFKFLVDNISELTINAYNVYVLSPRTVQGGL